MGLSYPLNDGGNALAHTDAHSGQPVAATAPSHFMDQGGHKARTAASERVTQSDSAAVDVDLLYI